MTSPFGREAVGDACCLLNIVACGKPAEVLGTLGLTLLVEEQVRTEVLYLAEEENQGTLGRTPVDLDPLEAAGHIRTVSMPPGSHGALVQAAESLTDQDARVVALAADTHLPLASDDGRVRKVAQGQFDIQLLSTLQLLHVALDRMGMSDEEVRQAAQDLRVKGCFLPPRWDPESAWFRSLLREPG